MACGPLGSSWPEFLTLNFYSYGPCGIYCDVIGYFVQEG